MSLLTFPSPATNGQLYPATPLPGENQYQYDGPNQTWRLLGTATGVVAGCYGDGTNVATFCVDATGRITSAINAPISSVIPDLQTVTTQGAVTTDTIDVGGVIAAGLNYPAADGAAGDYLTTDGAGNLSFVTPPVEDLDSVTTAGNTTANTIDVGGLIAAGLTYPATDGTANQVVSTDGSGNLGWLSTLKVVTPPTAWTDSGNPNEVSYDAGYFYWYDGTNWQRAVADVTPW